MKHTPTPWRLSLDTQKIIGDVTTEICDFVDAMEHMQRDERIANANLILNSVNRANLIDEVLEAVKNLIENPDLIRVANRKLMGDISDIQDAISKLEAK